MNVEGFTQTATLNLILKHEHDFSKLQGEKYILGKRSRTSKDLEGGKENRITDNIY